MMISQQQSQQWLIHEVAPNLTRSPPPHSVMLSISDDATKSSTTPKTEVLNFTIVFRNRYLKFEHDILQWYRLVYMRLSCVGPSLPFFHTSLTFLTCPGGLCTTGITDELFVTWYYIPTLNSIHKATVRMEPCILTAPDVRHLGWANERVSPSTFAPVV